MYRLYQTFSSNQTGNTVFLAMSVVNRGQRKFYLALTSLLGGWDRRSDSRLARGLWHLWPDREPCRCVRAFSLTQAIRGGCGS